MIAIVDRILASGDGSGLFPPRTSDNQAFWAGLEKGAPVLQQCDACGAFRYPIVPVCPRCSGTGFAWVSISGRGTIFSTVVYPRSYLPEFESLVPYVVATVELAEGPRLFGLIRERHEAPAIGSPVVLEIERWPDGHCVPAFRWVAGEKE
ncbi:MAG TPA: OB-fold domain-containing protein [Bauldia sp.]|nr:OB-fold domain-containing protein [Bauldia sp.]